MSLRMGEGARKRGHGATGPRYVPPSRFDEVDTASLGFTNGMLLEFPKLLIAGDRALFDEPSVAIVGSRNASPEGRLRAGQLARALAKESIVVMSGLAAGIDESAHREAIAAGGRTIAVVGTPLDKAYPAEHARLQETIYEEHLLVSPFPMGTRFFPSFFPKRNKVMARLARATVVIEAGDTSGTLHQVVASLEFGHPVFIAKSVIEDKLLTWPARFLGKPNVHELGSSSDVADVLLR